MVRIKRAYDPPSPQDGRRILVDRIWPRGLNKQRAHVDAWMKEIAPSTELRKWFGHDEHKWLQFRRRYEKELQKKKSELEEIKSAARREDVTLVYAAKDEEHNQAVVLKEMIEKQ